MSSLKPHDYDVLRALAEAGLVRAAQLHQHFAPGKQNLRKLQPANLKRSLQRLEKAGLAKIVVKGSGAFPANGMQVNGRYKKGQKLAHRWAVTEDGRLLSGFNPPT